MSQKFCLIMASLGMWITICIAGLSVQAQDDAIALQTAAIEQAKQQLSAEDASSEQRQRAAQTLLKELPASENAVVSMLKGLGPDESRLALCAAMLTETRPLPPAVGWALIEHLDQRDPKLVSAMARALGRFNDGRVIADLSNIANADDRPLRLREAAAEALGWQRSKRAAAILLELTHPQQPKPLQEKAYQALASMTGRDDLDMDRRAWMKWWLQTRQLADEQWRGELINNFVRRDETQRRELDYAVARLVQAQQALYRAAEPSERPAMLGKLLDDQLEAIRLLAVDLAVERLLDNQVIPESLLDKLRLSLADASQQIRARAALLLRDLNDAEAAKIIAQQLRDGDVTRVEALRAYLRVMAKLPQHEAVKPALEILRQPELRADAAAALAAFADKGLLEEQEKNAAAYRIRQLSIPEPSDPELVLLLGKVGNDEDWQRIAGWLDAMDETLRQVAAQAWAASDRPLIELSKRANDPVILPIFLEAARQRGKDTATFDAIWPLKPEQGDPNAQTWRRAIIAVAEYIPSSRLIQAAEQLREDEQSLTLAEQLLSARLAKDDSKLASKLDRVDLLVVRARIRLISGEPAQAIADLDEAVRAMPGPSEKVPLRERYERLDRIDRTRIEALLLAGDIGSAVKIAQRPLAPRPVASDGSTPGEVAVDAQTLGLFLAAAKQRLNAQQPKPAENIIEAIQILAGPQPKQELLDEITRMQEDIAAMTPAVNGVSDEDVDNDLEQ